MKGLALIVIIYYRYRVFLLSIALSIFYIKPQHIFVWIIFSSVALYLYSTSNRNRRLSFRYFVCVALYLYSTSNRNSRFIVCQHYTLLYIYILHQTATDRGQRTIVDSCFISIFYIKPQPGVDSRCVSSVALYLYSTSNRNCDYSAIEARVLLYIYILHQTATLLGGASQAKCCFISIFYIKPQPRYSEYKTAIVALYLYSTSNRNLTINRNHILWLLYIYILHQTATNTIY